MTEPTGRTDAGLERAFAQVDSLLAEGPQVDAPSSYGALTRAARRLSSRLTRHADGHRSAVESALRAAVEQVDADARRDHAALAAAHAEALDRLARTEARIDAVEVRAGRLLRHLRPAGDAESLRRTLSTDWTNGRAPSVFDPIAPAVRLETRVGSLLVAAHDRVMLPLLRDEGWWEDPECEQLLSMLRPGMTFVDIGAHVGFMTLLAAGAVGPGGRVLALEPSPSNFDLLVANVAANGMSNVQAVEAAALDRTGRVGLSVDPFNTGDNRAYALPAADQVDVAAFALDDIVPEDVTVDVMKVDAQGTDHLAIRGMMATLRRSRSVLLVEFWPPGIEELGDDPVEVLDEYRDLGFEVRVLGHDPDGPVPVREVVLRAASSAPGGFCSLVLRLRG